ncbi:urease accessory protein [Oleomonas cavernae]|uniref:Urease accessory protein n=1 Tax=Oleomonas cavernae TaxID=2320859 RepID=A0A418WAQ3_9PROT|nr:HupE/UreJ family protein [Oleomonas cavernae]RJF87102.1 urease accessory protein [Oleomonas cavernae]
MPLRPLARRLSLAAVACLLPTVAFAHGGHGDGGGLAQGFAHPIAGLDHILAMVTVGIFAWQMGGRALWLVPASFVGIMAVGGALGVAGVEVPLVELGIALSVIVLGAVVAAGVEAPPALAMGLVGFFAVFHGHAHGAEMPQDASAFGYGAGFMAATALLHLGGIGLGFAVGKAGEKYGALVVRAAGGLIALGGLGLLGGAL